MRYLGFMMCSFSLVLSYVAQSNEVDLDYLSWTKNQDEMGLISGCGKGLVGISAKQHALINALKIKRKSNWVSGNETHTPAGYRIEMKSAYAIDASVEIVSEIKFIDLTCVSIRTEK